MVAGILIILEHSRQP